ncbi:MAG: T9SS type A sorting domain-containing protein [bacterium]|nr:T9SS type A sorting domain-containing protein [bacterium]
MVKKNFFIFCMLFLYTSLLYPAIPAFKTEGYEILQTKQLTVRGGSSLPILFDWDGDNKRDLIIVDGYRDIYIYFNQGSDSAPSFDRAVQVLRDGQEAYFSGKFLTVYIATNSDMNADGRPDLLTCVDGKVSIFTNLTRSRVNPSINSTPMDLTFAYGFYEHIGEDDPAVIAIGSGTTYQVSGWPVVLDYNNDGKKDIMSAYLLNAYGSVPVVRIAIYTNISPLASVPYYGTMIRIETNINPFTFYYEYNTSGEALPYAYPVDWDKNGTNDIILSYTSSGQEVFASSTGLYGCQTEYSLFKLLKGKGGKSGQYHQPVMLMNAALPVIPFNPGFRISPFVCDWGNDGIWDILSGNYMGYVNIIRKVTDTTVGPNPGAGFEGVLQQSEDCPLYIGNASRINILDWDRDGDWDIFVSAGGNGQQFYILNYGNNIDPLFKKVQIIQDRAGANIIRGPHDHSFSAYYDLNGDGKRDLVIGGENLLLSPQLVFCSNTGTDSSPVFSSKGVAIRAGNAYVAAYNVSGTFADMNSDGLDDMILSSFDSRVQYCLNQGTRDANGLPVFSAPVYLAFGEDEATMTTGGLPSIPNVLDWDKEDGKRDIVAASGSKVIYYLDKSTSPTPLYAAKEEIKFDREILNAGEYSSVYILDWDDDGYYDIFLCNTSDIVFRYKGMQLRYVSENDSLMPEKNVYTYPNPLRQGDTLDLKFLTRDDSLITIELYTISGRLIERIDSNAYFDRINTAGISCKNWANGIYIFRIKAKSYSTGEEVTVMKKFAVIR